MALEDAETLAHTMAHVDFSAERVRLLHGWEAHRQARLRLVKDLTHWSGRQRAPSGNFLQYYIKEWAMWAVLKIKGPQLGLDWLYNYNPEDIASIISAD